MTLHILAFGLLFLGSGYRYLGMDRRTCPCITALFFCLTVFSGAILIGPYKLILPIINIDRIDIGDPLCSIMAWLALILACIIIRTNDAWKNGTPALYKRKGCDV
jgi:hypothetical protein